MFELKIIEPGVFKFDYIATQAGQSSAGMPENGCRTSRASWSQKNAGTIFTQFLECQEKVEEKCRKHKPFLAFHVAFDFMCR